MQCVREEALAFIQVAEFVKLPEKKVVMSHAAVDEEGYFERLQCQLSDAKNLPQYLATFARRFVTGSYATVTASAASSSDEDTLMRDAFGFRQIIVAATPYGKLFSIDSSNGRVLVASLALDGQQRLAGQSSPPKCSAHGHLLLTFHVNALMGGNIREENPSIPRAALQGLDAVMDPLVDVFILPNENRTTVMLNEYPQARLYPDTPSAQAEFKLFVPSIHLALCTDVPGQHQIMGHQLTLNLELSPVYVAYPMKGPQKPYDTVQVPQPPPDIGPYIFPTVQYIVPAAGGVCAMQATLTENWLVYQDFDDEFSGTGQSKGYRVISVGFYEGDGPNDKTKRLVFVCSELSSYSNKTLDISAYEQSFTMAHGIAATVAQKTVRMFALF
ncbi:hypothetical protein EDB19DRAFT_1970533 [Suillus lakei]|nr:hypothetical protein EDB19DRAFT_1970533 [Suillus lakei]